MFHFLAPGDNREIAHRPLLLFLDSFTAFFEKALHTLAGLPFTFSPAIAHLFEAGDVAFVCSRCSRSPSASSSVWSLRQFRHALVICFSAS